MNKIILALALSMSAISYAAPSSPESCQLKINGQTLWTGIATDENGQGFFSAASQFSQSNGSCVYAKIDQVPHSGRVYNGGALVPSGSGRKKGLTNSEAQEAMSRTGGYCMTLSCIPLQYDAKPGYEQPVQVPSIPQSTGGSAE
jgi:hypothetical protein